MGEIIYFSSVSGNTHRFIEKLGLPAQRIPLRRTDPQIEVTKPYVLILPTYGGGPETRAVPKQVIKFLNVAENRQQLRGVIVAGNTNFGEAYGLAGEIVAQKCQVPLLYKFELFGTSEDVTRVREGLAQFWKQQQLSRDTIPHA